VREREEKTVEDGFLFHVVTKQINNFMGQSPSCETGSRSIS
jgi:hypothetical protein